MTMTECPHKPTCPTGTPRWRCGYRSTVEAAVKAGELDPVKAQLHLQRFGLPINPVLRAVYRGQPKTTPGELW